MDQIEAESEVVFRLVKIIFFNMQRDGIISQRNAELIKQNAIKELNPIIGCLEDEHYE